jgi:CheY-like chemotaxis protein
MPYRIAFLGFTESERHALSACFRLAQPRNPSYEHVATLTDADLLVADADHAPSVRLVLVTERQGEAVFIGAQPPAGAAAWLRRPIDALQVMRELDGLVTRIGPGRAAADGGGRQTTIIQAMQRQRGADATPPPAAPAEPGPPAATPAPADGMAPDDLPLTLRDPPTPSAEDRAALPQAHIFPGAEGLVGHEPPLPAAPGGWAEDLAALHRLPVLQVQVAVPQAPPELAAAAAPPAPPATAPAAAPTKPPKPPKIPKASLLPGLPRALLVDDSVIALLFLEKRLDPWQIRADTAPNSQAALALLAQHSYDLVFLDVELGEDSQLDGLALCRQIKQTPASMNALVVMVSAHHGELDRVRGTLAGCDAYLGKPLDAAELQRLLQRQGLRQKSEAGSVAG